VACSTQERKKVSNTETKSMLVEAKTAKEAVYFLGAPANSTVEDVGPGTRRGSRAFRVSFNQEKLAA